MAAGEAGGVHVRESDDRDGVQRMRGRKGDAEIAAVAALPARPGVGPEPRQRRGGEGEAEEQQRGARGEADHHADAVDLELPHAGDPDAERDQDQRQHAEQPPAFEPVLPLLVIIVVSSLLCNHQLHWRRAATVNRCNRCLHSRSGDARANGMRPAKSCPDLTRKAKRRPRRPRAQSPITTAISAAC